MCTLTKTDKKAFEKMKDKYNDYYPISDKYFKPLFENGKFVGIAINVNNDECRKANLKKIGKL